ncbi:hypothetical protein MTO96_018040 [Rhipicephalus appendiculatus]
MKARHGDMSWELLVPVKLQPYGCSTAEKLQIRVQRYLRPHDLVAPGTITDNCYDHCILLEKFKNSLEHKPGKDISWCSSFAGDWLYPVTE